MSINSEVGPRLEMVRGAQSEMPLAEEIGADQGWFGTIRDVPGRALRIAEEDLSIAAVPLGFHGGLGIIVAGAAGDFQSRRRSPPRSRGEPGVDRCGSTASTNGTSRARSACGAANTGTGPSQQDLRREIAERTCAETQLAGENELLQMVASGRARGRTTPCRFVEDTAGDCICSAYLIDWTVLAFQNGAAPSLL
jgi:hypothetical protein